MVFPFRLKPALCLAVIVARSSALFAEAFSPGPGGVVWQDRVLPLPQHMRVADALRLQAGQIHATIQTAAPDALPLRTARTLLEAIANGTDADARLRITLMDRASAKGLLPDQDLDRLADLPNADQAYIIRAEAGIADAPAHLHLVGNTPVGMQYAARTLHQLLLPGPPRGQAGFETWLTVPLVEITDWPALELRGEWGSSPQWNMDWYSQWKINMYKVRLTVDPDAEGGFSQFSLGNPMYIPKPDRLIEVAGEHAYHLIPYIGHIGHSPSWLESGVFRRAVDEQGRPRARGLCWSDPAVIDFVARTLSRTAQDIGRDVEVWMTESGTITCHCEGCAGENGYRLEAQGIVAALRQARQSVPNLRLMLLLSQGTRVSGANERIFELLRNEPDAGITYYDGHLTYRINREPLIFDALEAFAQAGGRVDVVPIFLNYGVPIPSSMPGYVQFRAREFADKGLVSVTGFTERDRRYCEVNQAAFGEFAWNPHGRSTHAFARAYAVLTGIDTPERFAEWVGYAETASWARALVGHWASGNFNRDAVIEDPDRFDRALESGRRALALAREANNPLMILESETTLVVLKAIPVTRDMQSRLRDMESLDEMPRYIHALDALAHRFLNNAYAWEAHNNARMRTEVAGRGDWYWVHPLWHLGSTGLSPRMTPAAYGMLRATDALVEQAGLLGIEDPRGAHSPVELAEWVPEMFDEEGRADLALDLTDLVPTTGGSFILGLHLLSGNSVLFSEAPHQESLLSLEFSDPESGDARIMPVDHNPWIRGMNSRLGHAMRQTRLAIPARQPNGRLMLRVGMRRGGQGSHGVVTIRAFRVHDEPHQGAQQR